jgi:hypothetical protein
VIDAPHRAAIVTTAGAGTMLVGTFLPWLRSGARNRSSYTIFDLVERLGFAPGGVIAWSLRLWPLVPLLIVVTATCAWAVVTHHVRWGVCAAATVTLVVWVGGTATAVFLAPDVALFRIGVGPTVTLVGAVAAAAGVAMLRRRGSGPSAAV